MWQPHVQATGGSQEPSVQGSCPRQSLQEPRSSPEPPSSPPCGTHPFSHVIQPTESQPPKPMTPRALSSLLSPPKPISQFLLWRGDRVPGEAKPCSQPRSANPRCLHNQDRVKVVRSSSSQADRLPPSRPSCPGFVAVPPYQYTPCRVEERLLLHQPPLSFSDYSKPGGCVFCVKTARQTQAGYSKILISIRAQKRAASFRDYHDPLPQRGGVCSDSELCRGCLILERGSWQGERRRPGL